MTNEEIIEGNKIIETFNSGRLRYNNSKEGELMGRIRGSKGHENIYDYIKVSNLKYHYSFGSLMPVVKRIQQLPIEDFSKKKPVMSALMDVEIESLWLSIVVFIKWYNQNKV